MSASLQALCDALSRLVSTEVPPLAGATTASEPAAPETAASTALTRSIRPALGAQLLDYSAKGYHLEARLGPDQIVEAARILDEHGYGIDAVTGMDWMAENEMEVVYDFFHPQASDRVALRVRMPRTRPEVPTISEVFPGANWHERETHDFFGIRFLGHPDLSPLLLPEDADYHPLRKDFAA
jgi:NADH-quinone oxidoreductase subunit C